MDDSDNPQTQPKAKKQRVTSREVRHLVPHIEEIKKNRQLKDEDSFYTRDWREIAKVGENDEEKASFDIMNTPQENTLVLLQRLRDTYDFLYESFSFISTPTIGKVTNNIPVKFDQFRRQVKKENTIVVMIVIAKFTFKDIPKDLVREWSVNTSMFAQLYQGLLLKAAKRNGIECEDVETRTSKDDKADDEVSMYVMFNCSK